MTRLAEVVATSRRVAGTSGRLAKVAALAELLRRLSPEEIEIAVAYLSGETRQGKLGLGYSALRDARGGGESRGDPLRLAEVDAALERLSATSGKGSAAARTDQLGALFARAHPDERDFLARLIVGELRQGALEGVMLDAIARAAALPAQDVRRAAMYAGGLAAVARAALTEGAAGLARFSVRLLQPVQPMLATPADDVAAALAALGTAALEWKLDGARVQVHKAGDDVRVFTRNLNDVTAAVPEVVEAVRTLPARELILDGETIALAANGTPLPFQVTMRRFGRKLEVDRLRRELPLAVFFFDALRREGDDLVDRPAHERFAALADAAPPPLVIPRIVTGDVAEGDAFLAGALAAGHEGIMAKAPEAPYEAGRRGSSWLKIKRAHTLDLVVLAAEWGSGRREGWLSNLHLGARDPGTGGYVMLGKTFKGLTDETLEWQTAAFLARETAREGHVVHVRPEIVAEIAFNDLQASPHYPGGLALRFARLKRYRPDKTAAEADTIETVRALYEAQVRRSTAA
ncbi:MAG TPA: ATP-dependent DNA ligase [Burkholderiales bacterium]|nr:ATP-dependent DNA ligase [Burkholderiales bacterium]